MKESTELINTINALFGSNQIGKINLCSQDDSHSLTVGMSVPANLHWFEGHFPEQPVLAGVVQTHWAIEIAQKVFSIQGDFEKINNLKFKAVIMPDTNLVLTLNYITEKHLVKFNYRDDSIVYSQGQIYFTA